MGEVRLNYAGQFPTFLPLLPPSRALWEDLPRETCQTRGARISQAASCRLSGTRSISMEVVVRCDGDLYKVIPTWPHTDATKKNFATCSLCYKNVLTALLATPSFPRGERCCANSIVGIWCKISGRFLPTVARSMGTDAFDTWRRATVYWGINTKVQGTLRTAIYNAFQGSFSPSTWMDRPLSKITAITGLTLMGCGLKISGRHQQATFAEWGGTEVQTPLMKKEYRRTKRRWDIFTISTRRRQWRSNSPRQSRVFSRTPHPNYTGLSASETGNWLLSQPW